MVIINYKLHATDGQQLKMININILKCWFCVKIHASIYYINLSLDVLNLHLRPKYRHLCIRICYFFLRRVHSFLCVFVDFVFFFLFLWACYVKGSQFLWISLIYGFNAEWNLKYQAIFLSLGDTITKLQKYILLFNSLLSFVLYNIICIAFCLLATKHTIYN